MKLTRIKIKVRHVKNEKVDFYAYKAVATDGSMMDAQFTKACLKAYKQDLPTQDFFAFVPEGGSNVSYAKEYPKTWINELAGTKLVSEEIEKNSDEDVKELYGDAVEYDKELPF